MGPSNRHVLASFRCGTIRCGLAVADVERVLPMAALSPLPGAPEVVLGLLDLHGQALPVVDLRSRLRQPEARYGPAAHLLVVRTAERRMAVATDEVEGVAVVPQSSVSAAAAVFGADLRLEGVAATPDGMLLIHDVEALLSRGEVERLDAALPPPP